MLVVLTVDHCIIIHKFLNALPLPPQPAGCVGRYSVAVRPTNFVQGSFYFITFASPAGGLRHCNAAAFASLKKFAALIVFNPDCVGTEPKEAPYATTGEKIGAVKQMKSMRYPK